ncbi:MAG: hypothetical protein LBI69_04230 [Puniceicoccales bacterium]|nr:hypothetical protein [Puniceicoccales bacterium]
MKDVDEVKKAITNPANEMLCAKFIQHLSEYNTDKNPIPEWIQGDSSDVKEKLGKMSSDEWKELQTYINNTPPLAAEMYMIDASMQENLNEIICIKEEGKDPVYVDINGIVDDDRKNAMEGKETKVINCKRNSEGKMEYVSEKRSTPEIQPSNANPISSDERPPSVQQKKAEKPKGNMTEEQEKAFKKNPFLYSCTKGSARRAMIEGKGDISPLKGFANDIKGAGKWIGSKWSNLKNKITGGTDEPPAE